MPSADKNKINIKTSTGVAAGNGNNVTVNQHTINQRHVHTHSESGNDGGPAMFFGLAFAACAALAIAAYEFALHASMIYSTLQVLTLCELAFAAPVAVLSWSDVSGHPTGKQSVLCALCVLSSIALYIVHAGYPQEFTILASQSPNAKDFWCLFYPADRQIILLHLTMAIVGFGIGSALLATPIVTLTFKFIKGGEYTHSFLTSWWIIAPGATLILTAMFFYTPMGWDIWTEMVNSPPHIWCAQ